MTESDRDELIAAALDAQRQAYAPYSNFAVGAALRTACGAIYRGCNVENASFGLTICAERTAAVAAIAAGERVFDAIAVASTGGVSPCGACRQFLAEFGPAMHVVMVDSERSERVEEATLAELLPMRFVKK